jgi:hypothetical protein
MPPPPPRWTGWTPSSIARCSTSLPIEDTSAADTAILPGPDDVPRTTARRPPVGLRLEQTQANGITPSRTSLALRRRYGCWWIAL